jgi:hypothetical protein
MNVSTWINKINTINNTYLSDKPFLIDFITLCKSKYLTLAKLDISAKVKKMLNYDYTLVWDCEFQVFASDYKCKHILYEIVEGRKLIRCVAELGLILLVKLNNDIYIGGLFHCGFLNKRFNNNIGNYMPFYHEYMSTTKKTERHITSLEEKIYPHLIFLRYWQSFLLNKNVKDFSDHLTKLLSHKILKTNKHIYSKFEKQLLHLITSLEADNNTDNDEITTIINKINNNLKSIIYSKLIKSYKLNNIFEKIHRLYINDKYVRSIMIEQTDHHLLLSKFAECIKYNNCVNIIKGIEDVKAINNHNLMYECNQIYSTSIKTINHIDIAEYNDILYRKCYSAKLYDTYVYLMQYNNTWSADSDKIINDYMKMNMKAHNPLVDAYYTLSVFIQFNEQHICD